MSCLDITNRMRNLHSIIENEFGRESVTIFRKNGNIMLRSLLTSRITEGSPLDVLSQRITPVSLRLKSNMKTERQYQDHTENRETTDG